MEELLMEEFFEAGGLVLVGLGLAAIGIILDFVSIVKEKGDSNPFISSAFYIFVACICGVILNFLLPIIGFFIGFAISLKILLREHISFWNLIFLPITLAIYTFVYFASLAWFLGGMEEGNILFILLGGFIFLVTLYYGILKHISLESSG